ncbi:MAG: hypothetical protein NTX35_14500 [Verrucomicrobia bacterium]|nr:hypothetical protein [Verrucomicrobiota bacterium]
MLDIQRYRGAIHLEEIQYTRKWMWLHMILGAAMITLFLFHEIFQWFAGAVLWYAVSLMVMYRFMGGHRLYKWLLALIFLLGAAAGVFFINRVFPGIQSPRGPVISKEVIPIWVGIGSLGYTVSAVFVLCSRRIGKAAKTGFTLW